MTWFNELLNNCWGMLKLESRAAVGVKHWNAFVDHHPSGSWWHGYEWLDYCLAYKGGADYSLAMISPNGAIAALYPLIYEGRTFALGGNPLVPALMSPGASHELAGAAVSMGKHLVNIIARHHGVACAEMMLPPSVNGPLKHGLVFDSDDETESTSFTTRVVDLTVQKADRWKAMRKSYHQLIHRAEEKYTIVHHDQDFSLDHTAFEEYCWMHSLQYRNARRSVKTYDMQKEFLKSGMAHLYIVNEKGGFPEGATLWYIHKGLAYYASGVYRKDNLAHMALWQSMNDLAARGIKYAELGWQGRATDQKGRAVEFFKRGFGGTDWPVPCIRRMFLTHQEAAS